MPRTLYPYVDAQSVNVVSQWNLQPLDTSNANVFAETQSYGPTLITYGNEFALDAETEPIMRYRLASAAELRFPDPSQCNTTSGEPDLQFVNSTICGGRDWRELCNVTLDGVLSPATILYNVNVSTPVVVDADGNVTYQYILRNITVPCRRPDPTLAQTRGGTALPLFPGHDPIKRFVLPGAAVNLIFNITDVPEPPVWRPATALVQSADDTEYQAPSTNGVVGTCRARPEGMNITIALSAPLGAPLSFPIGPELLLTEDDTADGLTVRLVDRPQAAGLPDVTGHSGRFKAVVRNVDSTADVQLLSAGSSVQLQRPATQSGSRLRLGVSLQSAQPEGLQASTGDSRLFLRLVATDSTGLSTHLDVVVSIASLTPLGGVAVLPASVSHEVTSAEPATSTEVGVYADPSVSWAISGLLPPTGSSRVSTLPAWLRVSPMGGTGPTVVTVTTNGSALPHGLQQSQLLVVSLYTVPPGQSTQLTEEDLVAVVPVEMLISAPSAVLQPSSVAAAAQPGGSAAETDLLILNTGTFPMTYSLTVADAGAQGFLSLRPTSAATGALLGRTNVTSGTVPPGGNALVVIVTDPSSLSTGEFKGSLLLASSDAARPRVTVPVSMRVSWIALCPDEIQLAAPPNGYAEEVVELTNLSPFDISVALDVREMPEAFVRGSNLVPPTGAQITLAASDNRLPVSLPPRTLGVALHYASAESLLPGTFRTQFTVVSWRTTAVERSIQTAIADPVVKAGFVADLDTYLQSVGATFIERRVVSVRYTLEAGSSSASTSFLSGPRLDVLRALQTPVPVEAAASQAPVFDVAPTPAPSPSNTPAVTPSSTPLPSMGAAPVVLPDPNPPFTPAALARTLPANAIMHASVTVSDAFGFAGAEQPLGALQVTVDGYSPNVIASLTDGSRQLQAEGATTGSSAELAQRVLGGHARAQAAHKHGLMRSSQRLAKAAHEVKEGAVDMHPAYGGNVGTKELHVFDEKEAARDSARVARAGWKKAIAANPGQNAPAAGTVSSFDVAMLPDSAVDTAPAASTREPAEGAEALSALQAARHSGLGFWGPGAGGGGKNLESRLQLSWTHAKNAHLPRTGKGSLYASAQSPVKSSMASLLAAEAEWRAMGGGVPFALAQQMANSPLQRHADNSVTFDEQLMAAQSRVFLKMSRSQQRQVANMQQWLQAGEANAHMRSRLESAGRQTHMGESAAAGYLRPVTGGVYYGEQHHRRMQSLQAADEALHHSQQAPVMSHAQLLATTQQAALAHTLHTAPGASSVQGDLLASLGESFARQHRRPGKREQRRGAAGPRLDAGDLLDASRRVGMLQQWSFPVHGRGAQAASTSPIATVTVVYEGTSVAAAAGNLSSLSALQQEGLGLYSVYVRPLRRGSAVLRATISGQQLLGSGHIFTVEGAKCNPFNTTQSSTGLQCQCAGGFSLDVAAASNSAAQVVVSADSALSCIPCSPGFEKPQAGNSATCDVCPDQSYSVGGTFPCQPCLASEGADCSNGQLSVRKGYWFAPTDVISLEQAYSTAPVSTALNVTQAQVVLDLHRQMRLIGSNATQPARLLALSPGTVLHRCPGDQCSIDAAGTGVQCSPGSRGPLCAVCEEGYESNNGLAGAPCNECPSFGVSVFITVLVFGAMSAAVTVAALQQRSAERTLSGKAAVTQTQSMVRILLNWLQASAVLGTMQLVGLSPLLSSALGVGTAAEGFSLGFYPVRCAMQLDFYETLYAYLIMPFVAVLVPHAVALAAWQAAACGLCGSKHAAAAARATRRRGAASRNALNVATAGIAGTSPSPTMRAGSPPGSPPAQPLEPARAPSASLRLAITSDASTLLLKRFMGRATTSAIVLLFLLHFTLLRSITRVFVLYQFPIDGVTYIANDFTATTADEQYSTALALAITGVVVYIMGIPALGLSVLYRNRDRLQVPTFAARFSFLYSGLKMKEGGWLYLWEGVVLVRKIAMVFIATFAADNALQQGYLAVLLLVVALLLQVRFEPYARAIVNQLETAALSTLLFTQVGVLYYASTPTLPVAILVVLLNILMALVFAVLILTSSSKGMLKMARRLTELASALADMCCPRRCRDSLRRMVEDLRFAETGHQPGGKGAVRTAIQSVLGGATAAARGDKERFAPQRAGGSSRMSVRPRAYSPSRVTSHNPMFANPMVREGPPPGTPSGHNSTSNSGSDGEEHGIELPATRTRVRAQGDVSRVMYYAATRSEVGGKRNSILRSGSFRPVAASRHGSVAKQPDVPAADAAATVPIPALDARGQRSGTVTKQGTATRLLRQSRQAGPAHATK